MGVGVAEFHGVAQSALVESRFAHIKIYQRDGVHVIEPEIPVRTLRGLFADGEGGIKQRPIFEKFLERILHLHDKFFAVFRFAIHIENRLTLGENIT